MSCVQRGPHHHVSDVGKTFAYVYYKANLFQQAVDWLALDKHFKQKKIRISRLVVNRIKVSMLKLKLETADAEARGIMCKDTNIRAIVRVVWFMMMARKSTSETIMCPLQATTAFVHDRYKQVCKSRYDYIMVYKGFNAIGRCIDLSKQPTCIGRCTLTVNGKSDERSYYIYNPMTTNLIKQALLDMPVLEKENREKRGEKRGAPIAAYVANMVHIYDSIKTFMLDRSTPALANRRVDVDSQDRHILQRRLMTFLATCISMTFPNRCVEYTTFSWFDLRERVWSDGVYCDVPLILRCMLSPDARSTLPPVQYYYMDHYCGKTAKEYVTKLMHALPQFASLISLPEVFEFVARITLSLTPHMIFKPRNNPLALMIYQVPNSLSSDTDTAAKFLTTSSFGVWLTDRWCLPKGAVHKTWIMPYSSRVTFARTIVKLGLLRPDSPEAVRLAMRILFGHTPSSRTIENVYARQCNLVQAHNEACK